VIVPAADIVLIPRIRSGKAFDIVSWWGDLLGFALEWSAPVGRSFCITYNANIYKLSIPE